MFPCATDHDAGTNYPHLKKKSAGLRFVRRNMSFFGGKLLPERTGGRGGHFACACVNPLNDNSVGASNLMAGNRKLARKITVLFVGALNTVLSYKNYSP